MAPVAYYKLETWTKIFVGDWMICWVNAASPLLSLTCKLIWTDSLENVS